MQRSRACHKTAIWHHTTFLSDEAFIQHRQERYKLGKRKLQPCAWVNQVARRSCPRPYPSNAPLPHSHTMPNPAMPSAITAHANQVICVVSIISSTLQLTNKSGSSNCPDGERKRVTLNEKPLLVAQRNTGSRKRALTKH
jgi:hypothetical protein